MAVLQELVVPGQDVSSALTGHLEQVRASVNTAKASANQIRLGFGLRYDVVSDRFLATVAGPLQFGTPCRFWVGCERTRYQACVGDLVVGIVSQRGGDYYRVDFGATACQSGLLHSIEGFAVNSRRNRPNIPVGGVVFGRITSAHRDLDGAEMSCQEEVETGEEGFGYVKPLPTRCIFATATIDYALELQRPDNAVLAAFGKHIPFEVIVGANGLFVLTTPSPQVTWLLGQAIVQAGRERWPATKAEVHARQIAPLVPKPTPAPK